MNMNLYTAFWHDKRVIEGELADVAAYVHEQGIGQDVLVFEHGSGRQIDLDVSGDALAVRARYALTVPKKVGRPKLGVVAKEVTLLKKQWDWLEQQSGSISATLRQLVDQEMNQPHSPANVQLRRQSIDRFMAVMLGNSGVYEEASRALYQGDGERFFALLHAAPHDVRQQIAEWAQDAFPTSPSASSESTPD